jgi:carbamoyl-phosphate synthase large subunit
MNILICSAGRRVSLVHCFRESLNKRTMVDSKVLTVDLSPSTSPACLLSDGHVEIGRFSDPTYPQQLLDICLENDVKLVVPTIDTELMLLAQNREQFEKHGVAIVVSDESLVQICRDKRLCNKFFESNDVAVPKSLSLEEIRFPFFIKPYNGSSSQDIFVVKNAAMLSESMRDTSRFMHMEYLDPSIHTEYTVDMYYSKDSVLRCLVPRVRLATRSGEISKGVTCRGKVLDFLRERFSKMEGARGCITLQLFHNEKQDLFCGIEINPRFGGGFPLSYKSGADYPGWLIDEYIRGQAIPFFDGWENGLLMLRYDQELFVRDGVIV